MMKGNDHIGDTPIFHGFFYDYGRKGLEEFCLKIYYLDVPLEVSYKRLGSAGFLNPNIPYL